MHLRHACIYYHVCVFFFFVFRNNKDTSHACNLLTLCKVDFDYFKKFCIHFEKKYFSKILYNNIEYKLLKQD